MRNVSRTLVAGAATVGLLGATLAFTRAEPQTRAALDGTGDDGTWRLEATGARIIGGYGDNFAYDGENVRPLEGRAEVRLNTDEGKGRIEITLETTPESGPIRFSSDRSFRGEIRIVQMLDTEKMGKARIAEDVFLHGDTGNEAPVMPKIYNYFATWGPSKIFVNGEEVVPMIGSHTMFSEQARGPAGKITNAEGTVYTPKRPDKTGYTDPDDLEFHYVAHTSQPDGNNFPPHSGWIHLHFSDVNVIEKPAGAEIPYTEAE